MFLVPAVLGPKWGTRPFGCHAGRVKAVELGEFLRTRRERLEPSTVGLHGGSNRRTPGLRREEVAVLAGVGVSWLTRLEQGRANRVSAEVLSGLSSALRLDVTERSHLFNLAGVHQPSAASVTSSNASHQRLVDALNPNPAYLLDHHWDLVAWNSAEEDLFPLLLSNAGPKPNLLRLFLERDEVRRAVPDWTAEIDRLTRQFRAHVIEHPSDRLHELTNELRAEHELFAACWDRHDVAPLASAVRVINHRTGQLRFDQHRLALPEHPGWQLVLFVPAEGQ